MPVCHFTYYIGFHIRGIPAQKISLESFYVPYADETEELKIEFKMGENFSAQELIFCLPVSQAPRVRELQI